MRHVSRVTRGYVTSVFGNLSVYRNNTQMNNDIGHNPCEVSGDLVTFCAGAIPCKLSQNSHISHMLISKLDDFDSSFDDSPLTDEPSPCQCSSFTYSLQSACQICQGSENALYAQFRLQFCIRTNYSRQSVA